jgi:Mg2+/Co2+ transporter CorC
MIETSMQLTISSRRDIAVLQKESSALEGEEDVNELCCFIFEADYSRMPRPRTQRSSSSRLIGLQNR